MSPGETLGNAVDVLLGRQLPGGHWRGRLADSALATAVASFALATIDRDAHAAVVDRGLRWLAAHANPDGGWGDTTASASNLSTTLLCWCALTAADPGDSACVAAEHAAAVRLAGICRGVDDSQADDAPSPEALVAAILRCYGNDRTFSAPILAMAALAGRLDAPGHDVHGGGAWAYVPQLPFELGILPHGLFRWVRLPVVSYALPALIAIGLVAYRRKGGEGSVSRRWLREALIPRLLTRLRRLQPEGGGFLEAVPLTAFVAMSLAAAGCGDHPVVESAVGFLLNAVRPDGSWPIDSDLAVWVTTLAVNAWAEVPRIAPRADAARPFDAAATRDWLLGRQTRGRHPFTDAAPGGWGWTDLPGSVPDADDTAGALLALHALGPADATVRAAAQRGVDWLLGLQNRDGGWPTFCRGWGKLPFDRSCPDIAAHVLRAFDVWYDALPARGQRRVGEAMEWGVSYLVRVQRPDGAWIPLWFGNERASGQHNLTYGTSRVVVALSRMAPGRLPAFDDPVRRGVAWLVAARNPDGGWGGGAGAPSSIEETALAVEALAAAGFNHEAESGVAWLCRRTGGGRAFPPSPIGLYFASLWYWEDMYPLVFTVAAMAEVERAASRAGGVSSS